MSRVVIQGNASGTGDFTIAAPNSNTNRTLTLPDVSGTLVTGDDIAINGITSDYTSGTALNIDSSGRVTMPYQPMACATWNATQAQNTVVGSNTPIVITNVGNHLSNGRFTCPVAGVYRATFVGMTENAISTQVRLRLNAAALPSVSNGFNTYSQGATYTKLGISGLITCAANDVLDVFTDLGSGGVVHNLYGQISFELVG